MIRKPMTQELDRVERDINNKKIKKSLSLSCMIKWFHYWNAELLPQPFMELI